MVSFQCDACADTVKKPKLDQHRNRCRASFTCLDCSTTFNSPGEYKSHTSCVTEAEKYQGALYKGPKKNGQPQPSSNTSAAPSPAPTPAITEDSAPAATTSSIHPSRLNQLNAPEREFPQRGGPPGRGGRGGFQRGGFQRGGYGGVVERSYATDMNKLGPQTGMRSWGSPAASAENTPKPEEIPSKSVVSSKDGDSNGDKKKKKNKKGDKGGTGSKANSKHPKPEEASEEPLSKKRKFEESESTSAAGAESTEVSSKIVKRLKKRVDKMEEKDLSLKEWIDVLGKDKEKNVDASEILKAVRVSKKDGQFVISI
ncbi:uncharacterized protein I206_103382 [Kwoniella pini CBS 10737]|uniref:Zinc finger C2H2 LYAR-type domain-containing protein n=1 Tax=Kwoniella pini CBS 10737 TaxID=1296096 RepID=A0A1B9IA51_9TREE|nr:uncharacterized protein I206_01613 [Kwoniella pini CBS 10737]OCF52324.1 hypothetical protein I206_01613 [Kwoniella pini CBS 10737]